MSFRPSTSTSRSHPVKLRHFQVLPITSNHVTSFRVTRVPFPAHYSLVNPETHHNRDFFGLLQALPGDFRSNNVTSGTFLVTSHLVASFPVTRVPSSATYSAVGPDMHSRPEFSAFYPTSKWLAAKWRHFRVTSGHFWSHDVTSWHVTATACELLPLRNWQAPKHKFSDFYSHFQVTSGQMTSLPVTWGYWGDFLSRECHLLQVTAL